MPMLLGMILGALLTIAGALTYDTLSGRAPNGLPPSAVGVETTDARISRSRGGLPSCR